MNTAKRLISVLLSVLMCVSVLANPLAAAAHAEQPAAEVTVQDSLVNLALHKTAVASSEEATTVVASNATDGDTTDGNSRWGSVRGAGPEWIYVDLGAVEKVESVKIYWESGKAAKYAIQVADTLPIDEAGWQTVKSFDVHPAQLNETITLDQPVDARYVRLYIESFTNHDPLGATVDWNTISIFELEVYGKPGTPEPQPQPDAQDPNENVALHKTAVASSIEADSVRASNATDGDTTSRSSRWGSNTTAAPHWIYVDLGKEMNVQTIRLYWEQRKATAYAIQLANTTAAPAESDWQTVADFTDRPKTLNETITLNEVHKARYVRLLIHSYTAEDPDGGTTWASVSIYEMEVFGGVPAKQYTLDEALAAVEVAQPAKGDTKLNVTIPQAEGIEVKYNGTDLEQVVGDDLTIYQPVVDKTVKVSFKATKTATGEFKFREVTITVPGAQQVTAQDNKVPDTLPVVQEWKGASGSFVVGENAKVLYTDPSLQHAAEETAKDYKIITGKTIAAVQGTADQAAAGDIVLTLNAARLPELGEEGYAMDTAQKIVVEAAAPAGAYYATRTILQSVKKDGSVPCGVARDYPTYEMRGFMLDVGRKSFSMEFLQQIVQQMAWYKMNDLQIHLNDNYIWLEQLDDPMSAYSAFRLESDVKEGGNGGKNKADLTSKDVFYTKAEFRDFIQNSRKFGVNIVPEIDTPAHSLALTKVRPDLRHGTSGRQNDHLNLAGKYDESFGFVKGIFDEYMTGADPVFDAQTTVHVGADEYEADREAYRRFADDMLAYVQGTGRQARIWGSLTQIHGNTPVRGKDVQIQLWNANWADMKQMYTQGFDLINCNDRDYYIVPNAGYYFDVLNDNTLYNQDINRIGSYSVPAGDDQMIGGMFAVWNDMIYVRDSGVSEHDVYQRIRNAFPLFGAKLWGKGDKTLAQANELRAVMGDAPQTNFNYAVETKDDAIAHYTMNDTKDTSGNGYDLADMHNASMAQVNGRKALQLNGGESFVSTTLPTVGLGNDLRVKVMRTTDSKAEQILFESEYGSIKAVQKETGKVGFSREGKDYSFDYTLPVNEWVELEFKNALNTVSLYVNGKLADVLGDGEQVMGRPLLATTMLPVSRIGSTTKAFTGYVDDVRIGKNAEFNTTVELDRAVEVADMILKDTANAALAEKAAQAKAVIDQYAPEKAEIERLTAELNALLEGMEYRKADYTRVDAYIALVPEDLTQFTPDSVKALEAALAGVQRELPLSMQANVDAQEKALQAALAGLTLKSEQDMAFVDPATMKATASSYQKDGSDPGKVLDGDLHTMWHTDWTITKMPHWIDLEMAQPTAVDGLVYTPRQGNGNGRATSFRIEKSDDGVNYTEVITGSWKNSDSTKTIRFEPVVAKHIRLVILAAGNNNGSAVEIRLSAAKTVADVDGLNKLIAKADKLNQADYTAETWAQMQTALAKAKAAAQVQPPVVNDVETAKRELAKAVAALTLTAAPAKPEEITWQSNLVVSDGIEVNFYGKFPAEQVKGTVVEITVNKKTVALPVEKAEQTATGYCIFPVEMAARQMTDNIHIEVKQNGQQIGHALDYTVRDNADALLESKTVSAETKEMVRSMLYYGAQMQIYKDYYTERLATAGLKMDELEAAAKKIQAADLDAFIPRLTGALGEDLALHGMNLDLKNKTVLRYFFTAGAGYQPDAYTFQLGNQKLTPAAYGDLVAVALDGVSPQYLDEMPELTVTGGGKTMTVKYGPMSYVRSVLDSKDVNLQNVARSMVLYNRAAKAIAVK